MSSELIFFPIQTYSPLALLSSLELVSIQFLTLYYFITRKLACIRLELHWIKRVLSWVLKISNFGAWLNWNSKNVCFSYIYNASIKFWAEETQNLWVKMNQNGRECEASLLGFYSWFGHDLWVIMPKFWCN